MRNCAGVRARVGNWDLLVEESVESVRVSFNFDCDCGGDEREGAVVDGVFSERRERDPVGWAWV